MDDTAGRSPAAGPNATDRRADPRRIVAELGRPETPEETAARKTASSTAHRANQTTLNLVISLLASLGVVLVLVLVAVQPNLSSTAPIDYPAVAASAQADSATPLASPALPKGWVANAAEIRPAAAGKVVNWYIGFITPSRQFIGMSQGVLADETWVASQVGGHTPTTLTTIGGTRWKVYDYRADPGHSANLAYAMSATTAAGSIVLFGTGSDTEFRTLASALEPQIGM